MSDFSAKLAQSAHNIDTLFKINSCGAFRATTVAHLRK